MTNEKHEFLTVLDAIPTRCSIIMDENLNGFHLANAIAVIALTVGKRHPVLLGEDLIDASGEHHPGLIPSGIPMLCAGQDQLHELRKAALAKGMDVVDFTTVGQETKNYEEYLNTTSEIPEDNLKYLGIALIGSKNAVSKLTKNCAMMK